MSQQPASDEPQPIVVDYRPVSDVRPSPYLFSFWFSFVVFCAKLAAGMSFVVAIISLVLGASGMEKGISGGIAMVASGCFFAAVMYSLQMLADIEQHTFRSAQCLTRIVESQERKREKAQQPASSK